VSGTVKLSINSASDVTTYIGLSEHADITANGGYPIASMACYILVNNSVWQAYSVDASGNSTLLANDEKEKFTDNGFSPGDEVTLKFNVWYNGEIIQFGYVRADGGAPQNEKPYISVGPGKTYYGVWSCYKSATIYNPTWTTPCYRLSDCIFK
jgi:hypothetical protein